MTQLFEQATSQPITLVEKLSQEVRYQNGAYDPRLLSPGTFATDGWLTAEGAGTVVTFLSEDAAYANVLGVYLLEKDSGNRLIEPRIVFARADDDAASGALKPGTSVDIRSLYDDDTWARAAQDDSYGSAPDYVMHRYGLFLISNGVNKYPGIFGSHQQPHPDAFDGSIFFVNEVDTDDPHSRFEMRALVPGFDEIISADNIAFTTGGFRDDLSNINGQNPFDREYSLSGRDTTTNSFIIGFEDKLLDDGTPAIVTRVVTRTDVESGVDRDGSAWLTADAVPDGLGWTMPGFDTTGWQGAAAPYPVPKTFIDGSGDNLDPALVIPGTGAKFIWQNTPGVPKPDINDLAGLPDTAYFRYEFDLARPAGASVTGKGAVTADDFFELFVNGILIESGNLAYDPADKIPDARQVDFGHALRNGPNTIAIKAVDYGALEWLLFDGEITVDRPVVTPGRAGSDFDFNDVVISIGHGGQSSAASRGLAVSDLLDDMPESSEPTLGTYSSASSATGDLAILVVEPDIA